LTPYAAKKGILMRAIQQRFTVSYDYPVLFTRDVFDPANPALAEVMRREGRCRALVAIDSEVARLTPGLLEKISHYGEAHQDWLEFVAPPFLVRGGEICKREPVEVEKLQALVERHKICRHSYILAIGGGAVLDAVGYAAATAHRGVRLVRLPSTVDRKSVV
jgi:3-dehydroquinate synthase